MGTMQTEAFFHPQVTEFTAVIMTGTTSNITGSTPPTRHIIDRTSWTLPSEWGHVTNPGQSVVNGRDKYHRSLQQSGDTSEHIFAL